MNNNPSKNLFDTFTSTVEEARPTPHDRGNYLKLLDYFHFQVLHLSIIESMDVEYYEFLEREFSDE